VVIRSLLIAFLASGLVLTPHVLRAEFPEKPVELVVYTNPGGALDIFARTFAKIASRYTDADFNVVNQVGSGGIAAIKELIAGNADGYSLMAVTRSNIGKIISTGGEIDTSDLTWLAIMVSDPEAIITLAGHEIDTWEKLVADAMAKHGDQVWVGPARGGNDHIMAMRTWRAAGINARWIPYASGGKAMAALSAGKGVAYVGNPQDVLDKPHLRVLIISSPERLGGKFDHVPTFREKGVKGLDGEVIWRGFAVKNGTPKEALFFFSELFEKVHQDRDWRAFIQEGGANPVFMDEAGFSELVARDKREFIKILKELGAIN
jgi:tripartite-type tricarboxylate transporter receptor subunit TctC